jgi:hypothetical protein
MVNVKKLLLVGPVEALLRVSHEKRTDENDSFLAISAGRMNAASTADRIIFKISSKACPRLHLTLLYYFSKQGGMNP